MSPEEMRIAIAEACNYRLGSDDVWHKPEQQFTNNGESIPLTQSTAFVEIGELPDFIGSRNAAISAVLELCDTYDKQEAYANELYREVGCVHYRGFVDWFKFGTATAEQICKALVKALNLEKGPTQ